ncbi:hypothetical protein AEAC466_02455 [Asticcacaulis sp. AC466]|uniref:hypothetical protein n=1 Tax=Asticcacaulis sp. AC466 TaxID=1282362 RepID=UPI0003C403AC|nr:hypothetical protein [Asticcacaulis sp. AC466]ESQ86069.1 hypothetical protein AEAC466_02455 [Asticcacaulis sp. AC466]
MPQPSRLVLSLSIGVVVLTSAATCTASMAASAGGYLNWSNKPQPGASAQTVDGRVSPPSDAIHTSNGSYPVPASPYGQVGDPFARSLRWPTKAGAAQPTPVASQMAAPKQPQIVAEPSYRPSYQPMPQAPVHADSVASISTPIPLTAPRAPQVVAVPQPEDPGLADDPGMADAPAPATVPPATSHAQQLAVSHPLPVSQPSVQPDLLPKRSSASGAPTTAVANATAPKGEPHKVEPSKADARTAESAPVLATTPAPGPADRSGAYQVPATSKYAARIDSARAAQAQAEAKAQAQARQTEPVAAPGKPEARTESKSGPSKTAAPKGKPADQATPPEPTASLASQETDHVFIPGERATGASDEPRFYSLHRQYGIKPDPITVDHDATGALLGINGIDAVEGGDPNNDHDSADSAPKQPDSTPR